MFKFRQLYTHRATNKHGDIHHVQLAMGGSLDVYMAFEMHNSIIIDGDIAKYSFLVKDELDAFHESQFFSIEHFTWPLNCQEIPKHSLGVFYNLRSSYMLPMCTLNVTMNMIDVTLTN